MQLLQFECLRDWKSAVSFPFGNEWSTLVPLLALCGNNNWPSSMKVKKFINFGLGCKWSILNSSGIESQQYHSWKWGNYTFSIIDPLGNKNWPPSIKVKKFKKLGNKRSCLGCKWSSLNAPGTQSCHSHSIPELGDFPFPIISPLG